MEVLLLDCPAAESPQPSASAAHIAAIPLIASRRVISAADRGVDGFVRRIPGSIPVAVQLQFVYHQSVNAARHTDGAVAGIAAAIGEPARARILYCLMDGHARTSTELAVVAEVSPSTASVHLNCLTATRLVKVLVQGKHRFYSLESLQVARALEGLSVLAGGARQMFVPTTPSALRAARTCYDHIAGTLGVLLHDRFMKLGWLSFSSPDGNWARKNASFDGDRAFHDDGYDVTRNGSKQFAALGIDIEATRNQRRRFAYACLDWSERRPHIGGALGAALLNIALKRKWVIQDLDSRILEITKYGRRELLARFDLHI